MAKPEGKGKDKDKGKSDDKGMPALIKKLEDHEARIAALEAGSAVTPSV